ncbi:MAG TPA: SPOR domain-containing protein, partial [Verrucomicrobiae bacterium]|nr:SPOR domain-containing protein [Verrucomicrobiae bacterium]
ELDRMAREREKMQLKPVPDQAPPMPVPPPASDSAPNATPTPLPPGRGASLAPFSENTAPLGLAQAQLAVALPLPIAAPENQRQQRSQPIDPVEVRPMVAQKSQALAAIEPAYALSVVKQNVELPKIPIVKPAKAAEADANFAPARIWTVQVASVEVHQDAENLASQLRKSGYEAYVVTAQLETKTWHRVRVGQLKDLNAAMALRRVLISSKSFKTAYVATR